MAFMLTRVAVPSYDEWKPMFDEDKPGARDEAKSYRLLRAVDNPNEVFVQIEFESVDKAKAGREKLLASGVLDRFPDHTGPTITEEAEIRELA